MSINRLDRRDFLKLLPAVPALAAVPRLRGARVKITDVRIVTLKVTKDLGSYPDWVGNPRAIRIGGGAITEIHTDQGVTGIGPGNMDPAHLPAVKNLLVGADPFDVDTHAQRLYDIQAAGQRGTAGVEIAIWDLIGKVTGQPLYKLWAAAAIRYPRTPANSASPARRSASIRP